MKKKIILYFVLGLCILGIIPLVLSLTSFSVGSGGGSSPHIVEEQTYSLTATSDEHSTIVVYDNESNSVSSLKGGQEYTISVSVDEHYYLSTLTLNGVNVENNSVFIPTSDVVIVSSACLETFTLTTTGANCTISVLNSNNESVNSLTYGETYTISVSASSGYEISSITLNGESVQNNSTFTATQNTTINVLTSLETYTLTKTGDNCIISVLNSNNENVNSLTYGQTYTISVSASSGYEISSITLNGESVQNNSTFIASQNTTISVVADLSNYTLTKTGANCTISVLNSVGESVNSLTYGQTYTISVSASTGYEISSIILNGASVQNNSTFTASQNTTINVLTSLETYTLTTSGANCTISVLNSNNESVNILTYGQTYTISVSASSGYEISSITLNGASVQNNSTFTPTQNTTINVVADLITYTLTKTGDNCIISVLNSVGESVNSLTYGQTYTISVSASSGYEISSITLNGVSVQNNSTFTATQNTTINVVADLITYTLTKTGANCTISVKNSNNESVNVLTYGQTYTISVSASTGYKVDEITLNGVSVQNNSTFTATQNTTINVSLSSLTFSYSIDVSGTGAYETQGYNIYVLNSSYEKVNSLIFGETYFVDENGWSTLVMRSASIDGVNLNWTSDFRYLYFVATKDVLINVVIDEVFCCVSGDTLISMFDGTQKRADEVVVGDKILSYNFETGEIEEDIVDEQVIKYRNNQVTLTFTDGTEIKITNDHQLYSEFGWKCYDYQSGIKTYGDVIEVCEDELSVGDKLFSLNKMFDKEIANISVEYAEDENSLFTMYTFCVHNNHNYFSSGLLSHNTPCL